MKLYAISDLHLAKGRNVEAIQGLNHYPEDYLVIVGDVGEKEEQIRFAFDQITPKFKQVAWVPGNHDLWSVPGGAVGDALRGEEKYLRFIQICDEYGVAHPQGEYPILELESGPCVLAPTFTLYDYSFRPKDVAYENAVDWSAKEGVVCRDESLLHPDPYPSRKQWCEQRCQYTEQRLAQIPKQYPIIIANHFPLLEELAYLPRIPTFKVWCGTTITESWIERFNIKVALYGHLHIRSTKFIKGVCFEEVSLGYPTQWDASKNINQYLRQIDLNKPKINFRYIP